MSQSQLICIVATPGENDVRIIVFLFILIAIYAQHKPEGMQFSYTFAAQLFKEEIIMEGTEIPTFGEALATFRTQVRLSQSQLAKQISKTRRSIAAWEAGDYLPKTKGDVLELARILMLDDEEMTILLKAAGMDSSRVIWNIPYPRNPFFTGRDQELDQLHVQMQQGTTAFVGQVQSISGLGGIGKTQFAIEYAYRYHSEYQYILWARAESIEALNISYFELARLLKLPEKDAEEQEKVIQAIKRWLQRQRSWLLILDNADSPALLSDFLPPTLGGHLLITTRASEINTYLASLAHSLVVKTFSDELGSLFLLHRSGLLAHNATLDQAEAQDQQLAAKIAHELGGLPLALDQAGAYLKATSSSLATYQQLYQRHSAQLLAQRRGFDHPEPVAATWTISFRNVELHKPAAADLLRLCAFLAPDAIPEAILIEGRDALGSVLAPVVADTYLLNEVIEALRTYSLIVRDPHTQTLTIHRLVQAVLRDSMSPELQQQWIQCASAAVEAAFPNSDFADWPTIEGLLSHALTCAMWIEQTSLGTPEADRLLNKTGNYLHDRAQYQEAEPLFRRVLVMREQQHPLNYASIADALNDLGGLYESLGKYNEVEPLYQRALAICKQHLGSKHLDTAISLNSLALLYKRQGKYTEAEPLYQRALAIREQQLGEHPDTATSLNNLASLYKSQGRYPEAESLFQRALAIREEQLGNTHLRTVQSLNNLAAIYDGQKRYAEAEPLYQRALAIREQQLGEHPDTATTLSNLGFLYKNQGRYAEAESLFQRALEICEQRLGFDHPYVIYPLRGLAELSHKQKKYVEAESLFQRALEICEQCLGFDHPDTQELRANYTSFKDSMKQEGN